MAGAAGGVMNRNNIVIAAIVLAVVAICVVGFFLLFKRESVTESGHPTGEAAYNRFYALERTLADMGQASTGNVNLSQVLPLLKPGDTVVIGQDVSYIKYDEAIKLVAWVRHGGHLVFSPMGHEENDVPLMQQLNVLTASKNNYNCTKLWTNAPVGKGYEQQFMSLCGVGFKLLPSFFGNAQVVIHDRFGDLAFARISDGEGTVSAINDLNAISADKLRNYPEQEFAWRLLEPNMGQGHFYFFYELIGTSFWVNVFLRGWPALLASLLLAIGWMSMRSQRFGPLMPTPPAHRRALLEHIQAVGEFLFRRDGGRSLHRLACQAVIARLRRRDPAGAMLRDAELYDWLAQRSKLEPSRIEHAFRSPANAASFRVCITTLARIRSHL
jgi:hypothetical protein